MINMKIAFDREVYVEALKEYSFIRERIIKIDMSGEECFFDLDEFYDFYFDEVMQDRYYIVTDVDLHALNEYLFTELKKSIPDVSDEEIKENLYSEDYEGLRDFELNLYDYYDYDFEEIVDGLTTGRYLEAEVERRKRIMN